MGSGGKKSAALVRDDKEIASLEKKLGLKGRRSLPQSFHDDGLADLLDGLDDDVEDPDNARPSGKRKAEVDRWLSQKRRKANADGAFMDEDGDENEDDFGSADPGSDLGDCDSGDVDMNDDHFDGSDDSGLETDDNNGSDLVADDAPDSPKSPLRKERENPYIAPPVPGGGKYIPPAKRRQLVALEDESAVRLRQPIQGLVNRLTEANMLAILADMEKFYREHPRQHVTDVLVGALIGSVGVDTVLPDTFFILHAAFSTAVYKVVGIEFGAHLVQLVVARLKEYHKDPGTGDTDSSAEAKQALNLMAFLTELYCFKLVGSTLIFDYIRLFLGDLSEFHTELLLRIIRTSGQQLRQDDPLALKDIVALLRPAIERVGEQKVSVRTRFMVDTIIDLKNNKTKKAGAAASAISTEHATRMKKLLGALSSRKLESTEPLRIDLQDIEQADKRGKWWLVGASWAGAPGNHMKAAATTRPEATTDRKNETEDDDWILGSWGKDFADVAELEGLARDQGLDSEVQISIFVSLLSAVDYEDACARLLKLKLSKYGKQELPRVLLRCVGAEERYNPYYAQVARRACTDRTVQWAFQASLWTFFKRIGESLFGDEADDGGDARDDDDDDDDDDDEDDASGKARRLVHLARLYAHLLAMGRLELRVLRCLRLKRLGPSAKDFMEVLIVSLFREARAGGRNGSGTIRKVFAAAGRDHELARGLRHVLRKLVRKSALVSPAEAKKLGRACDVAEVALEGADTE